MVDLVPFPASCFGYSGSRLAFISNKEIVYACSNGLCCLDIESKSNQMVRGQGPIVEAVAVCAKNKMIAYSDYSSLGRSAVIYVYDWENKAVVARLLGQSHQQSFQCLDFSNDGALLVSLGSGPDYSVTVWDWQQEQPLVHAKCSQNCNYIAFNNGNSEQILSIGSDAALFWRFDKIHNEAFLHSEEHMFDILELSCTCCCWLPGDVAAVGFTNGQVVLYDGATGQRLLNEGEKYPPIVVSDVAVTFLTVTVRHLVAACADGSIRWILLSNSSISYKTPPVPGSITTIACSPSWQTLVFGTNKAAIHSSSLPTALLNCGEQGWSGSLDVAQLGRFHADAIVEVISFEAAPLLCTISRDNTVFLWDLRDFRVISHIALRGDKHSATEGSMLNCGALSQLGRLVAVGDTQGQLTLIDFAALHRPRIVYREKLHHGSIIKVRWHPDHNLLVTVGQDTMVCFVNVMEDIILLLGRKMLNSVPLDVRWGAMGELLDSDDGDEPIINITHVLVSTVDGKFHHVPSPSLSYQPPPDFMLSDEVCFVRSIQLKSPALLFLVALAKSDGSAMVVFACTAAKRLRRYELTGDDFQQENLILISTSEEFGASCSGVSLSYDGTLLGCCDTAGHVTIFHANGIDDRHRFSLSVHDAASGGCAGIAFAEDGGVLFTVGYDAALVVHSLQPGSLAAPHDTPLAVSEESCVALIRDIVIDKILDTAPQTTIFQRLMEEASSGSAARGATSLQFGGQEQILAKLNELKDKFQLALNANKNAPDIEKLDENEFVIDLEMQDKLLADADAQVQEVERQVKYDNLGKELIWHRIKEECVDSMADQPITIHALSQSGGQEVPSYPILHPNSVDERNKGHVWNFRQIEAAIHSMNKTPMPAANLVLTEAQQQKYEQRIAERLKRLEEAGDDGDENHENHENNGSAFEEAEEEEGGMWQADDLNPSYMLYPAFELTTVERKIYQINFLRRKLRDVQRQFNSEVNMMLQAKAEEFNKIAEKVTRLNEIDDELKIDKDSRESYYVPQPATAETPGANLVVLDSEIQCEKFVPLSDQEELLRQKNLEEQRMKNSDQAGIKRALDAMMGGSLEVAKQNEVELLEKPDFMDSVDANTVLTEEQQKTMKEYEKRLKLFLEEKEKHRKVLEAEAKKLRREIEELCEQFDERLRGLWDRRLQQQAQVYAIESQMLLLAEDVNTEADILQKIEETVGKVEVLEAKVNSAREEYDQMKQRVDSFREEYEAVLVEDKQLEKKFRREFADHVEVYDALFKLFKKRKYPSKDEAGDVKGDDGLNPFPAVKAGSNNEALVEPEPLDADEDMPEGLEQDVWDRLIEVRNEKIVVEMDIKRRAMLLSDLNRRLQTLADWEATAQANYEQAVTELDHLRQQQQELQVDLRLLVLVKQGQLEVNDTGNFTTDDLADAVLVDRKLLSMRNSLIRQLGQEKVGIMVETKDFKRKIHMLRWDNQVLDVRSHNVEEDTRSYQLLRVTKSLQEMIKGGAKDKNAAEIATLEKQLEYIKDLHEVRVDEKKRKLFKIHRSIREKELENEKLEEYVQDLAVSVAQRNKILQVRASEVETGAEREYRMQELVWRRLVLEEARQQSEDIDILKAEVDRLRQRTFPSFAKNYQKNVTLR